MDVKYALWGWRELESSFFFGFGWVFISGGRMKRNSNLWLSSSSSHSLLENTMWFFHLSSSDLTYSCHWYERRSLWKLFLSTTGGRRLWVKEEIGVEIFFGVCLWGVRLIKQQNINICLKTGLLDTFIWSVQAFNKQSWNWNHWLPSNSSSPL